MTINNKNIGLLLTLLTFCFLGQPGLAQENGDEAVDEKAPIFSELEYRNVGPTRGGRATAVAGIPGNRSTYFMGATGGGVWKTTDYGNSWKNVSDGYFNSPSIGAIGVAPSDPNVIYVGTGSDGIRSNVITGRGVYKSSDQGKKWQLVGLENSGQIGAVEVHPDDPNTAYIAAIGQAFGSNDERGVFKTIDGGETWSKVLYISDSTGFADLEIAPDDPNIIYASAWRAQRKPWTIISGSSYEGGIYKSTDAGESWIKLDGGLPNDPVGKIDLAVSPANPDILWALVEAPEGKGGVYRSDDRGTTFELISTKKELLDRPFYYCNIDANPLNAESLFVNATQFWESKDGGKSWSRLRTPHGDNHDMWINPEDSLNYIQSNDGGANITLDGGKSWSTQSNQPTAELYQVNIDDQFPYWLYAGQQDNSTIAVPSLPPYSSPAGSMGYWRAIGGCETGPAVPKPGNSNIVYSNCKGRFGVYNKRTGQEKQYYVGAANMYGQDPADLRYRFQRVSPIHVSPHDPDVVYHASQFLHKSTDDGETWQTISPDLTAFTIETQGISGGPITRDITGEEFYSTIYAIQESALKEGLIWVGANDGPLHLTQDGGKSWANVTPNGIPGGGRVQTMEPSSHKEGKAYVAIYRYLLNDWKPYILKTEDYGTNWTLLTPGNNGIADNNPARVIREDPDREGLLYAGTEMGLFVSFNDGESWQEFQQNLPITPITDIKVHQKDLVISTMGRSFWILDDISPLHTFMDFGPEMQTTLFPVEDAYRMRFRGNSKNSIPHYPNYGAIMHYFLGEAAAEDLMISIRDTRGKEVRRLTLKQDEKQDDESDEPSMETGFFDQGSDPVLNGKPGLHRISWDLRHAGPWSASNGSGSRNGPVVLPGNYVVEFLNDGMSVSQNLVVRPDPRIISAGVSLDDMRAQEELSLNVRDLLSTSRRMAHQASERRKVIEEMKKNGRLNKKLTQELLALEGILAALETSSGRYMEPMIIDQIRYLSSMLDRADQVPGKDAYGRYEELKSRIEMLKPDWEKYLSSK